MLPTPIAEPDDPFPVRLDAVAGQIVQASEIWHLTDARNKALIIKRAADVLHRKNISTLAAALVADAERALVLNIPPASLSEAGAAGGRGEALLSVSGLGNISTRTISHMRSAHAGLPDDEYAIIRQRSIDDDIPLTRKQLTAAATAARLRTNTPDSTRLGAIPWVGGKNVTARQGTGQWVSSLLPFDPLGLYAEPYGGMAGVLLNRPPARIEVLNDVNDRIVNWWAVLRRWPDDLQRELERTPYSETEYNQCLANLDNGPPLERARAFTVVVVQGVIKSDTDKTHWVVRLDTHRQNLDWPLPRHIHALANRMAQVQITCRPATTLLDRLAGLPHAIIYCDPPYPQDSTDGNLYRHNDLDVAALTASLQRQTGRVALSGNAGDFDLPGWATFTRETHRSTLVDGAQRIKPRIECLWTNYDPETWNLLASPTLRSVA